MNLHPELHVALVGMRQAEIRREVAGERVARQAWRDRATVSASQRPWTLVLRLWAALAHAVPGVPRPRAA